MPIGLTCPVCKSRVQDVVQTWQVEGRTNRRRRCPNGHLVLTVEKVIGRSNKVSERQERREKGLVMLRAGKTPKVIALDLGVPQNTVYSWRKRFRNPTGDKPTKE